MERPKLYTPEDSSVMMQNCKGDAYSYIPWHYMSAEQRGRLRKQYRVVVVSQNGAERELST